MPARSLTGLTTCIRPICRTLFANKTHDDDDDEEIIGGVGAGSDFEADVVVDEVRVDAGFR